MKFTATHKHLDGTLVQLLSIGARATYITEYGVKDTMSVRKFRELFTGVR